MENKNKISKILVVQGSPRKKGNSIALAEQIAKGAESVGAVAERIYLPVRHAMHVNARTAAAVLSMMRCNRFIKN